MLKALCVCVVQGRGSSSWSLCQDPSHLSPVLHKGSSAICQESYQLITYSSECKRLVLPGSVNNLKLTPQCLLQLSTTNFHALKVVVMLLCFASFSSGIFCKTLFIFIFIFVTHVPVQCSYICVGGWQLHLSPVQCTAMQHQLLIRIPASAGTTSTC